MTSCSTGPAPRPQGTGQCGVSSPVSTRRRRRSVRVGGGGHLGDHDADLVPDALGVLGQIELEPAAAPVQRGTRRLGPQGRLGPTQLAQRQGPAQVQMGVVLPGEPHAPQDLDAALGALHVGVEGEGSGQHGREPRLVRVAGVGGLGGVPRQGRDLLHRHQHVGQAVLDRPGTGRWAARTGGARWRRRSPRRDTTGPRPHIPPRRSRAPGRAPSHSSPTAADDRGPPRHPRPYRPDPSGRVQAGQRSGA